MTNLAIPIALMFTLFFSTGIYPSEFKEAIVLPLYKGKGSKSDPNSYRPISILCTLNKILEGIIHARILTHLQLYDLLSQQQHGFRKNRSCFTALLKFTQDIFCFICVSSGRVVAILIDLRKAFDTVPHDKLIIKLRDKYGITGYLLKFICNYLYDRKYSIKLGDFLSKEYTVYSSVPQGGILAPLLFILYIDNIYEIICKEIHYILYTDDLVIYVSDSCLKNAVKLLESCLHDLNNWFMLNGL